MKILNWSKYFLCVFLIFMSMNLSKEMELGKYIVITKALFEKMLEQEKIQPHKLGYDRPSDKFICFLSKHYNLKNYIPQNYNFVVFNLYFDVTNSSLIEHLPTNN